MFLNTPLPKSWPLFLNDADKSELFSLVAEDSKSLTVPLNKQLIVSSGDSVVCVTEREDTSSLSPCNHKDAYSRLMVHLADVVSEGYEKFMIRTVDSDVVVVSVAAVPKLNPSELWVSYGTGKDIATSPYMTYQQPSADRSLSPCQCSMRIPDVTQYQHFILSEKKMAWSTWCSFGVVTHTFCALAEGPSEINEDILQCVERFTVLLYDRTNESNSVNEVRKHLFTAKGRTLQNISPTAAALEQHARPAALQGGYIWGHAHEPRLLGVSPAEWGWTKESGKWMPLRSSLPIASEACRDLIRCGCVKGCTGQYKCVKAAMHFTMSRM